MGHFQGLIPFFWYFEQCPFARISTLNFGLSSTKIVWTVWATKKWLTMSTDLILAGITEKRPFVHFAETCFFFGENPFPPKKSPKNCWNINIFFGKGYFFVCKNLPGRGRNMILIKNWVFFRGAKNFGFRPESPLLWDPGFGQWLVCSPLQDGLFGTLGLIFGFFVSKERPFL